MVLISGCIECFIAVCRLSLAVESGGCLLQCPGFLLRWRLLLQSTNSRRTGFSSCSLWALECRLSNCGTQAWLLCAKWNLPGPGITPVCSALTADYYTLFHQGSSSELSNEVLFFFFNGENRLEVCGM